MKNNRLTCAVLAALLSIQTLPASAAKPDTAPTVGTPSQNNPAPADAGLPADLAEQMVIGPAVIDLGNQAKLKLPAKMVFIKKEAANTMMEEAGNGTDPNRYGLILPEQENNEKRYSLAGGSDLLPIPATSKTMMPRNGDVESDA